MGPRVLYEGAPEVEIPLVDIARCERCGRVIPVLDEGCPYCEPPDRGLLEPPYLPLAIRMLLVLFVIDAAVAAVLAVATALRNLDGSLAASLIIVVSMARFLGAAVSVLGLVARERWALLPARVFIAVEGAAMLALFFGWIPLSRWIGGVLGPLWSVLFLFVFLREDVREYFDPRLRDRRELEELLVSVERGGAAPRGGR